MSITLEQATSVQAFQFFPSEHSGSLCCGSLFGSDPDGEPYNWSLAPLGPKPNPRSSALIERLEVISLHLDVRNWYAPIPTKFNGKIVRATDCDDPIALPGIDGQIWRGVHADGIVLQRGSGYLLSAGGCPVIVATDGDQLVVAHAGHESLFPFETSVVKNIAAEFGDPSKVTVRVFWSIQATRYTFELSGEHAAGTMKVLNRLYSEGYWDCVSHFRPGVDCIDLPKIIEKQAEVLGMNIAAPNAERFLPDYHVCDTRTEGKTDDGEPLRNFRNLIAVTWR